MFRRRGFTLVEVLVALLIISILVALLLPAVQSAREAARRAQCGNSLKQVCLALHLYEQQSGCLPPVMSGPSRAGNVRVGWRFALLPFLEQQNIFVAQHPGDWYEQAQNLELLGLVIPQYQCPSTPGYPRVMNDWRIPWGRGGITVVPKVGAADQVGPSLVGALYHGQLVADLAGGLTAAWYAESLAAIDPNRGPSMPTGRGGRFADIDDGLSNTLLVGERSGQPGYYSGNGGFSPREPRPGACTVDQLPDADPIDGIWVLSSSPVVSELALNWENCNGFYSFHDGVNSAFCDGSVHFWTEGIDPRIVHAAVSRAGGEPVDVGAWR